MSNKVKTIALWSTLMRLAREDAKAQKSGDPAKASRAKDAHEAYRRIVLEADQLMIDGVTSRDLP